MKNGGTKVKPAKPDWNYLKDPDFICKYNMAVRNRYHALLELEMEKSQIPNMKKYTTVIHRTTIIQPP